MAIRIIAIGKKHESWISEGIERYSKRLRKPFEIEWVLLPHSSLSSDRARQEESGRILSKISPSDFVVLLDEKGKNITSPALSALLLEPIVSSKNIVIIIGGAYGVSYDIERRANFIWSLSALVFPHQLVRLILVEQLYRAQEIASGNPYHHE
jgi:23S rRNA (pseudouridine1915-N3)-methyltransferase